MIDLYENGKIIRHLSKHTNSGIELIMRKIQEQFPPDINSPAPTARVIRSGEPELLSPLTLEQIRSHTTSDKHYNYIAYSGLHSHLTVPLQLRGKTIGSLSMWITSKRRPFNETDVEMGMEIGRFAALAIDNARLYREAQEAISQREDFITIASHELKTPITSLKLQMDMLERVVKSQKFDPSLLQRIGEASHRQLDRFNRLIEDLLDVSRIKIGTLIREKRKVDLSIITQETIDRFKDQLKESGVQLTFTGPGPVPVTCDPFRIEQVISNLITNAIRYGNKKPIEISITLSEGITSLSVRDFGLGIALSDQERIFFQFERGSSHNINGGLGLGLYISRQIMEGHGGTLIVKSELKVGSTFTLRF